MSYRVETREKTVKTWAEDIFEARYEAFGYLLSHKKSKIYIINNETGNLAGIVTWSQKKDKYGKAYGPCYYSVKQNKDYLLDLDGKIFTMNNKRASGQYRRKSRR